MALSFNLKFEQPRIYEAIEERASDWKPVLRRWTGYLKGQAKKKFKVLKPLSPKTIKRYSRNRTAKVTKAGKVRVGYARKLRSYLRRQGKDEGSALNATLEQLRAGDLSVNTSGNRALARLQKQLQKAATGKVVGGDKRKIDNHQILGKLAGALVGSVQGDTAKVENAVGFSKVQNEGGPVGNKAVLPARTTLSIESKDPKVLAEIVVDHLLRGSRG